MKQKSRQLTRLPTTFKYKMRGCRAIFEPSVATANPDNGHDLPASSGLPDAFLLHDTYIHTYIHYIHTVHTLHTLHAYITYTTYITLHTLHTFLRLRICCSLTSSLCKSLQDHFTIVVDCKWLALSFSPSPLSLPPGTKRL